MNEELEIVKIKYDATLIYDKPENLKRLWYEAAEKSIKENKGNTVISQLILNTLKEQPISKYISGPFSLYLLHNKELDRIVYIFGEAHGSEDSCSDYDLSSFEPINYYIYELLKNSPVFIDFFLETQPFYTSKTWDSSNFISDLKNMFNNCIDPNKTNCEYVTSRIHYFDMRYIHEESQKVFYKNEELTDEFFKDLFYSLQILVEGGEKYNYTNKYKFFEKQFDYFKEFSESEYIDFFMKIMYGHYSIKKELSKIDADIREKIILFIKDILSDNYQLMNNKFINFIFNTGLLFTDIYLLSRLFKKFEGEKYHPEYAYNSIIYAGNYHSQNYIKFLTKYMNYDILSSAKKKSLRCLNIKDFPQPFFIKF